MTSNLRCRPGDLAVIIGEPCTAIERGQVGAFVTVLYLAPQAFHQLPDGLMCAPAPRAECWVVEFPEPMRVPTNLGSRLTRYGAVADSALQPLRPGPAPEAVPREEPEVLHG